MTCTSVTLLQGGDGYSWPGAQVLLPAGDPYVDVVLADLKKQPEGVSVHKASVLLILSLNYA
jgi:hypothetical protein